jgi:hypothetical protein
MEEQMLEKLTELLAQLKAVLQTVTIRNKNEEVLQKKLVELEQEKTAALELINQMSKELHKF